MSSKMQGLLWLLLLFGIPTLLVGIFGIIDYYRVNEYTAPIYISKEFELVDGDNYTLQGQFTNLTNKPVTIQSIRFSLQGREYRTVYYGSVTEDNIVIPAQGVYNYKKEKIKYAKDLLNSVSIVKCIIEGENVKLAYSSDGITFGKKDLYHHTIPFLIAGIALLSATGTMIIWYFKQKKIIKY